MQLYDLKNTTTAVHRGQVAEAPAAARLLRREDGGGDTTRNPRATRPHPTASVGFLILGAGVHCSEIGVLVEVYQTEI